ncbi:cellulose synthase catalytic subunit [Artemisia annua]|uniref:Cellulose synthase catalytic subunit n=1 Tax=Artemisia annua TaxID=35608 RepID=A0A2U1KEJ2_ARTAN|nr:cellulose synthase catalytic subunit [Artemisia annua]
MEIRAYNQFFVKFNAATRPDFITNRVKFAEAVRMDDLKAIILTGVGVKVYMIQNSGSEESQLAIETSGLEATKESLIHLYMQVNLLKTIASARVSEQCERMRTDLLKTSYNERNIGEIHVYTEILITLLQPIFFLLWNESKRVNACSNLRGLDGIQGPVYVGTFGGSRKKSSKSSKKGSDKKKSSKHVDSTVPVFNLEDIDEGVEDAGFSDEKSLVMSQMSVEKIFGQSCWTTSGFSEKPISVYVSRIRGLPFQIVKLDNLRLLGETNFGKLFISLYNIHKFCFMDVCCDTDLTESISQMMVKVRVTVRNAILKKTLETITRALSSPAFGRDDSSGCVTRLEAAQKKVRGSENSGKLRGRTNIKVAQVFESSFNSFDKEIQRCASTVVSNSQFVTILENNVLEGAIIQYDIQYVLHEKGTKSTTMEKKPRNSNGDG